MRTARVWRPAFGLLPAAFFVALLCVAFFPFLFQRKHMVPFYYMPSWESGLAESRNMTVFNAVLLMRRFPGRDEASVMFHYPNAWFTSKCLKSGRLPLWNPYVGCGIPVMECGQAYPLSPFLAVFYAHPTPWSYTFGLLLGFIWSALGAWFWLRRFGTGPWVRMMACCLWAFNPWTLNTALLSELWAAWWFGWLLWSWDRALSDPAKRWWLPSLMIAGMVYSGHPETSLVLTIASFLYAWIAWFTGTRERGWRSLGLMAYRMFLAALLAGCLTAVHWLPVLSHLRESASYKLDVASVLTGRYEVGDFIDIEREVYVAPLMLCLTLLGAARALRDKRYLPPFVFFVCAIILVLNFAQVGWLLAKLPVMGIIPLKYYRPLLWYSVIPFFGLGLHRILHVEDEDRRFRAFTEFALASVVSITAWWMLYLLTGWPSPRAELQTSLTIQWASFSAIALACLWRAGRVRGGAAFLFASLVLLDPFVLQRFSYPCFNGADPVLDKKVPALVEIIKECTGTHGRFHADFPGPLVLTPNLATLWGARDIRVCEVLLPARYAQLHLEFSPKKWHYVGTYLTFNAIPQNLMKLLGVGYVAHVGSEKGEPVVLERVVDPMPRAFLAFEVSRAIDEHDSLQKLLGLLRSDEWRRTAILESPSPLPPLLSHSQAGSEPVMPGAPSLVGSEKPAVNWITDQPGEIVLKCYAGQPSALVLTDCYAAGWRALVDGTVAPLYPADLAFRAVLLPAGEHVVTMSYSPGSVPAGMAIAACAWLLVIGLLARNQRAKGFSGGDAKR